LKKILHGADEASGLMQLQALPLLRLCINHRNTSTGQGSRALRTRTRYANREHKNQKKSFPQTEEAFFI
jgi:hypothetical protein